MNDRVPRLCSPMNSGYPIDSQTASINLPQRQPRHAVFTNPFTLPADFCRPAAFEAVARHLNFRAASEEMALTQSAVSRQIQSLEEDVGVSLFHRHTRAVELTNAGGLLLRAVTPSLERIDSAVRQIRQSAGRKAFRSPPLPHLRRCG